MAELADAYGSGPYGGNPMKVQVLSPAPLNVESHRFACDFFYCPPYRARANERNTYLLSCRARGYHMCPFWRWRRSTLACGSKPFETSCNAFISGLKTYTVHRGDNPRPPQTSPHRSTHSPSSRPIPGARSRLLPAPRFEPHAAPLPPLARLRRRLHIVCYTFATSGRVFSTMPTIVCAGSHPFVHHLSEGELHA